MIDADVDPALFSATTRYVAFGVSAVGVPEMAQSVGDRTSPSGRVVEGSASEHDVTLVPLVHVRTNGSMGSPR